MMKLNLREIIFDIALSYEKVVCSDFGGTDGREQLSALSGLDCL